MSRSFLAAVALASAASLLYEVALTRIFSVVTWYHFSFAVVSLALLGLGAGASAVTLLPRLFPPERARARFAAAVGFAAIAAVASLVIATSLRIDVDGGSRYLLVTALDALAALLPFAGMGIGLGLALRQGASRAGVVYGADLLGAAAGAISFIPIAHSFGAPGAIVFAAVGFAAAAVLAADTLRSRLAAVALLLAMLVAHGLEHHGMLGQVKWGKGLPMRIATASWWNAYSFVALTRPVTAPPWGWGFGERPRGVAAPLQAEILIDMCAGTALTEFHGDFARVGYVLGDVTALVYAARPAGEVHIVGVGGGHDVLTALAAGARHVTGVELNDRVFAIVTDLRRDFAGLAGRPDVTLVHDEARRYLAGNPTTYDVIQISLIDTWAASASGAFALSENGLYTREAWSLFLRRLNPSGILGVTRWYRPDGGEVLRAVSLAVAALRDAGAESPERHIMVARGSNAATVLVKRTPFTEEEIVRIEEECARRCFEPLYLPDRIATGGLEPLAAGAAAWTQFARAHPTDDLTPPSDDRPFFFYFTKPSEWLRPAAVLSLPRTIRSLRVGHHDPKDLLLVLLWMSLGGSLLLLVLPAAIGSAGASGTPGAAGAPGSGVPFGALLYMALIGLAFMLVEIPLLTRLAVVLGHPVLSLAVVLGGVLVASGLGSLASTRLAERGSLARAALLPALVIALALVLPPLAERLAPLPTGTRIAASLVLVFVVGFPMGLPLPMGLRRMSGRHTAAIPLLFGINGAFSVCGSVVAMIVLLNAGTQAAFVLAAVAYAAAAIILRRL